ncbi:hypothetical protein CLOSTASPAR_03251, partial [[Clostridium] asparagiforme DSM 15981]
MGRNPESGFRIPPPARRTPVLFRNFAISSLFLPVYQHGALNVNNFLTIIIKLNFPASTF